MTPTNQRSPFLDKIFRFFESKKATDRLILKLAAAVVLITGIWFLLDLNTTHTEETPGTGGTLREGVIGTPRFINPVLALTRADRDVTSLVFNGLMRLSTEGAIVPHLAESVVLSDDGLTYTVTLREHLTFHDGEPITAEDVIYTVGRIQEPNLKSPLQANFDGVFAEATGEREVLFTLEEPFAPFIENLTFGIIPKHVWKDVSIEQFSFSQHNTEPIGSGSYEISSLKRNSSGLIRSYELTAKENGLERPNIDRIILSFFNSESELVTALDEGEITSAAGLSPNALSRLQLDSHTVVREPLPRTFGLFYNQNKSDILLSNQVRMALGTAIDREQLIAEIFNGYAVGTQNVLPPGFASTSLSEESNGSTTSLEAASALLEKAGWEKNEDGIWSKEQDEVETLLTVDIATANSDTFNRTASFIQRSWEELGVVVSVRQFEQSDLTQAIIRPRDYQILLFGTAVGRSLDFYAFWHSSARNDPGLNVALYTNIDVDAALEKLRVETDEKVRSELLTTFNTELTKDAPASFLFVPEFIYILPNNVTSTGFKRLDDPSERFSNIESWYMSTDTLWPVFNN